VLQQCRQPGASLAGVALGYRINPNMVHRWMREERQRLMLIDLQRELRHSCRCNCSRHRVLVQTQARQSARHPRPTKALPLKASASRFNVRAAR